MEQVKEQVVFFPGLLCNEELWEKQTVAMNQRYATFVADCRDHSNLEAMARGVLQQIRGKFSVVGFSMGGYVALEVMRMAPQRVRRLALIDTKARADNDDQKKRRKDLLDLAKKGKFKGVTPHLMSSLIHRDRMEDEPLKNAIYAMAEDLGFEGFVNHQSAILQRESHLPLLPDISAPTTIVCGRQDEVTPLDCSEEMHSLIRGSEMHVIEDCGHMSPMEHPHRVNEILLNWMQ